MVSRKIKRTPTKSIKKINRRRNNKSSSSSAASRALTSLNKSLSNAHRRLLKIFSNHTPKKYQLLPKTPPPRPLLPPPTKKKTIFLDLDETLIHSTPETPPPHYDFVVCPLIDNQRCNFYVLKRPHLDHFLHSLSRRFELVIFTAGIQEYAKLVVDKLDRSAICSKGDGMMISHRLYRDSCREIDGKYVKDLAETGRDLRNVVIVDDNPYSYMLQPRNGVGILPFTDDVEDQELRKLVEFFHGIIEDDDDDDAADEKCEDLRDAVNCFFNNKI